ncbi:hypothetical protein NE236_40410 [Actinoallomurus purpureus]|uniref:hypothetical protein n=1 Tax=Actinoallomurus purpureus TaxID=478114 RepID=UPI002093848E|nr:hypothetical protein [Actinoallomurus purpureus]MCO6011231.1 hypothetical protein [Actinoallomurus purpureus]
MAALSGAAAEMATATGTRTMAIQQRGRALAIMGDEDGALHAIGEAEQVITHGESGDDPESLYFYEPELLTMQRGIILAYLADDPIAYLRAANTISDALKALPSALRDSEWVASYRVRAAGAFAAGGEPDAASMGLRQAHAIVSATGGSKTLGEIARVHARMAAKWPTNPQVIDVGEQIAEY